MEITCASCSTRLSIPDESLPKDVPVVMAKCPQCQAPIEIKIPTLASGAPEAASAPAAAPSAPVDAPAPDGSEVAPDEEFVAGRKLAMACLDSEQAQTAVKAALEAMGYVVHSPAKPAEAIARLRHNKYEVLILHEEFGGSAQDNPVLKAVAPMAMSQRRHMCMGLVGKEYRSLDNMAAFARSVNFVVAERELGKIEAITRHAVAENDAFYRLFREAIHEAGRV